MKKFTFLFLLTAFIAVNVFGQTVSTEPAWDNESATPTVTIKKDGDVVVKVTDPKPNVVHTLFIPGAPPTIIEQVTSNTKGESFSFKPLKFSTDRTVNYGVNASDLSISTSFNVAVGTKPKKLRQ
ncbi:MAG: hypothetical protein K8R37_14860 [Bacteroidales bacterium]|nr:hypothetical protein [Bacteroidales bacterium]